MNVAFDRWVPVVTPEGAKQLASLREILTQGEQFADIAVRPHERVALMRLFLCVAHAALDGPKDYDDWCTVPKRLPDAAGRYLDKWKDSFELFHPEKPWLQVAALRKTNETGKAESSDWTPVSKLSFFFASGANTTLFDHCGMNNDERAVTLAATLVSMLAFQCFSPAGLISQVYWNKRQTAKSSKDGPCCPASMMHAFLRGPTLARTIFLNLPNYDDIRRTYGEYDIGRPVWETPPDSPTDKTAVANATTTFVGRLVPMTRAIRLHSSGTTMLLGDGLVYPTFEDGFPAEPSATVVVRKRDDKEEAALLSFRPDVAIWRSLGALVINRRADQVGGPLSLRSIPDAEDCDLVVAALARDKATILDTRESVYRIPAKLRSAEGIQAYEEETHNASQMAFRLGIAVERYRQSLDGGWEGRLKGAGPKKSELRAKLHSNASIDFWTSVETNLRLLFAHIAAVGTDEAQPSREAWRKIVYRTACMSYRTVCGQETPRQMKSFAIGWAYLTKWPKDSDKGIRGSEENAA